jgi:hypothetical protein
MKMMLSEFIKRLELQSNSTKVKSLVTQLKAAMVAKGDIEIDMEVMCKNLGIEI